LRHLEKIVQESRDDDRRRETAFPPVGIYVCSDARAVSAWFDEYPSFKKTVESQAREFLAVGSPDNGRTLRAVFFDQSLRAFRPGFFWLREIVRQLTVISMPALYACATSSHKSSLGRRERALVADRRGRVCSRLRGGKFDDGFDLFAVIDRRPIHNLLNVGAGFQIFKDDGDGHARALKPQDAAYLARDAFPRGAL